MDARTDIEAIVLAYGLCGRGTAGLRPLRHKLVIPRAHDCITVFMGNCKRRDLQTLPLEIQALSPALFNGKQFIADTSGQRDVYAGGWIMPGKILVCVINDSNTEAQEVAIRLPANAGPNLRPLFQGRPCSLKLQDGKIMGVIGPMQTQVYEISQRN